MFGRWVGVVGRLSALALVLLVSLVVVGSASAAVVHPFVGSFGSLGYPQAVALDESTGDIYVLDAATNTVVKFDASGNPADFSALGSNVLDGAGGGDCAGTPADCDLTPQGAFAFDSNDAAQLAVDNSTGPAQHDLYVTNSFNGVVDVFDQTGTYVGQIDGTAATPQSGGEVCGVAVSAAGDVYVSSAAGHVDHYTPIDANPANDVFISQLENLFLPCNLAVDSTGAAYVGVMGTGPLTKYDPGQFGTDTPTGSTIDPTSTAVAIDPSNDDVYVDEGNAIAQYDASGTLLGRSGTGTLGSSFGVAIRGATDDLFASDTSSGQLDHFGPGVTVVEPTVSINPPSGVTDSHATFSGAVNPQGTDPLSETSWHFEYSTDGGASWTSTTGGDAGTGTSDVPVSDALDTFLPDQDVQVRLVASNAAGTVSSSVESFTTTALPPDVTTGAAQDVALTHASLQGQIHPHNAPTIYWFEYGTTTAYGNSIPAGQDANAGSGNEPQSVIQPLYGLQPGTTYHYRLVARNVAGTTTGSDQTFTTTTQTPTGPCPNDTFRHGPAAGLPDCRAYELVSPPDKNGGEAMPHTERTHAAAAETPTLPTAIAFTSLKGFGDVRGDSVRAEYVAQRTLKADTNGWSTHGIDPPQQPVDVIATPFGELGDPSYVGDFSADLTHAVFRSWSPLTDAPNVANVTNLYTRNDLRTPGAGDYTLLSDAVAPLTRNLSRPWLADASADFSHVIFESYQSLTPEVAPCTPGGRTGGAYGAGCNPHLYEAVNGVVRLAGILPDSACGAPPCVADRSIAGQGQQPREGGEHHSTPHTISDDGRRVFFTDSSTGDGISAGGLYMRVDGTSTVQLNASESSNPSVPAKFWDASADGTRAFFTSDAALTSDTPADGHTRLFMYSAEPDGSGHHLRRIVDGVDAVIGVSDDGHFVYVVAGPAKVWHDETGTPQTDIIGTLTPDDVRQDATNVDWGNFPKASRVTPDGLHLLFAASDGKGLTGYDQTSACVRELDILLGCTELYVYSVRGDGPDHAHLHCASCDPDGTPATSDATDTVIAEQGAGVPADHAPRAISDDGRFVFFHTADALVPGDVNGKYDAYEYDLTDGSVHLLSTGTDPSDSYFLDASANGHDAFIATRAQLVGWDQDSSRDLYDARINGGVPNPAVGAPPCSDDACQGALSATPAPSAIGNATEHSVGNAQATARKAKPKRKRLACRKGYGRKRVKHRVRCVKKKRRHRAHARRSTHARKASSLVHTDRKGR